MANEETTHQAMAAASAATTAERERCFGILGKVMTNPTRANFRAAAFAVRDGEALADFTPPDGAPATSNG